MILCKKTEKQKAFYCPGVNTGDFTNHLETQIDEWSFSRDIDAEAPRGYYTDIIKQAFASEGVNIGDMSEAQARNLCLQLNGLNCFPKPRDEITEEQQIILNMLD